MFGTWLCVTSYCTPASPSSMSCTTNSLFNSSQAVQILVTSLAISWLRPSLNKDPCCLIAAPSLPCKFFSPAVGVRSFTLCGSLFYVLRVHSSFTSCRSALPVLVIVYHPLLVLVSPLLRAAAVRHVVRKRRCFFGVLLVRSSMNRPPWHSMAASPCFRRAARPSTCRPTRFPLHAPSRTARGLLLSSTTFHLRALRFDHVRAFLLNAPDAVSPG